MTTLGRLVDPEQFADMILKNDDQGRLVRMRDVARIELGRPGLRPDLHARRPPLGGAVGLPVARLQRPEDRRPGPRQDGGAQGAFHRRAWTTRSSTTPRPSSTNRSTKSSSRSATPCCWWPSWCCLFLQNWRSAIIPLVAVPVAIIGTFAVMAAMGFSLNNLTLFGLVLAIGIVVDDAIVVVEAVQRQIDDGLPPREAAHQGHEPGLRPGDRRGPGARARSSCPARSSRGITGQFFRQFALTIAVSTLISAFNSLTLSPALAAILLRRQGGGRARRGLARRWSFPCWAAGWATNTWPRRWPGRSPAAAGPAVALDRARWRPLAVAALVGLDLPPAAEPHPRPGSSAVSTSASTTRPTSTPARWAGCCGSAWLVLRGLRRPAGADLVGVHEVALGLHSRAGQGLPAGERAVARRGLRGADRAGDAPHRGAGPQEPRREAHRGHRRPVDPAGRQRPQLRRDVRDARRLPRPRRRRPFRRDHRRAVAGRFPAGDQGRAGERAGRPADRRPGHRGRLQDHRRGPRRQRPAGACSRWARRSSTTPAAAPRWRGLFSSFRADTPWLFLDIDRTQAKVQGVSMAEIFTTLQVYLGSLYVNDFNRNGRTWQVNVQADARLPQAGGRPQATEGPQRPRRHGAAGHGRQAPAGSAAR